MRYVKLVVEDWKHEAPEKRSESIKYTTLFIYIVDFKFFWLHFDYTSYIL